MWLLLWLWLWLSWGRIIVAIAIAIAIVVVMIMIVVVLNMMVIVIVIVHTDVSVVGWTIQCRHIDMKDFGCYYNPSFRRTRCWWVFLLYISPAAAVAVVVVVGVCIIALCVVLSVLTTEQMFDAPFVLVVTCVWH